VCSSDLNTSIKPIFKAILILFGFGFLFLFSNLFISTSLFNIVKNRQADFIKISINNAKSFFEVKAIQSKLDFFVNAPKAYLDTWLQIQVFFQNYSWVYWLQMAENTIVYILIFLCTYFAVGSSIKKLVPNQKALLFTAIATIILGVLIGTIVPVHGAISRYKSPFMPFFIFMLLSFLQSYKPNWFKLKG
jgi:hypothetical protein